MAGEKKQSAKEVRDARLKKIQEIAGLIKKKHTEDAVILGNEVKKVDTISSGSVSMDKALGAGGYPVGRVVEIYGQESSGKTTLTLHAIAEQQKKGVICAFIDAEHALDSAYAKRIGVNIDELIISQPDNGEQALQIAQDLVDTGDVGCIVIDSVAALTPKAEIEGEMDQQSMGLQARMMSKALRKLTPTAGRKRVTIFFINQMREKIGVMFGNPNTTTGGNALKFYASVRIQMLSGSKVKDPKTGQLVGGTLKCRIAKNKVASPGNETEIPVITGQGIDAAADSLELAKQVFAHVKEEDQGPIKIASGHHYFYGQKLDDGTELVKGKFASSGKDAADVLKKNPKLLAKLRAVTMKELADRRAEQLKEQ